MTRLLLQTIKHFWRQDLPLALGIAVSTAVITGALIVGDSMRFSLQEITGRRLGQISHTISAGDRYFTDSLAIRLETALQTPCAPLLKLQGSAATQGGVYRLPKVQILGIDEHFQRVTGAANTISSIEPRTAYLSQNLAQRLDLQVGDELLLRIQKLSIIPLNAPFVSDAEPITPITVKVVGLLNDDEMGRFQLEHIQSAPFNVFLSFDFLNEVMGRTGQANHIIISASEKTQTKDIESALLAVWNLADINLSIQQNTLQNTWEVTSERVFIDPPIQEGLQQAATAKNFVFTYFVNRLARQHKETPYSFVSTLPEEQLGRGEILLTQWLAEDLNAAVRDTITLDYFVIGPLRELEQRSASFVVKKIVPMTGPWIDPNGMPQIPGLSDVGNCSDWETGVPVDLEKIRKKDEDYWDTYRGTPKAYISYDDAQDLWQNRFGASTLIRFPVTQTSQTTIETLIRKNIDLLQLGFQVSPIREEASRAAGGGVDFSQLFLGLSFFLVLASLLLTVLLFSLNTESRMMQIGTLSTLGFTNQQIKRLVLLENGAMAVLGAATGLLLAIGYNQLVFNALNNIWSAIVRTDTLVIVLRSLTLLTGFGISLLISLITIYFSLNRLLREQAHSLQSGTIRAKRGWVQMLKKGIMYVSGFTAISLVIWSYTQSEFRNAGLFFAAGGLLLITSLLFIHSRLQSRLPKPDLLQLTTAQLIRQNIRRNYQRSFLVIALFAIGTFIVISTGANRRESFSTALEKDSGTGGFLFFAESTIPVLQNLNDPAVRFEAGLEGNYPIVQIRSFPGDDASCLNLNRVSTPGIWGVRSEALSERFRFVSRTEELEEEHPWGSLRKELGPNTIPAIADQAVIQWGLGLKVGDTLQYVDELGQQLGLKLIGGLANSIFQGSILIDEQFFLEHFPSSSGSTIFLIDGATKEAELIREELELSFRDHGWAMQTAAGRLAMFNSVENTYLSIFLILGGLGLAIGTIGLAIVLARNLLYRRRELGMMQALGFRKAQILQIITTEHSYLLLLGLGIGISSSILASLPAWLNPNLDISPWSILWLIGLIFLIGLIWIVLATSWFLREEGLIEALREE